MSQGFGTYEQQCEGKRAYSKKTAKKLCRSIQGYGRRMNPYRCVWCEGWHIGHRVGTQRVGMMRETA